MAYIRRLLARRRVRLLLPIFLLLLGCVPGPTPSPDRHYLTVFGHRSIMIPGATVELPLLLRSSRSNRAIPNSQIQVSVGQTAEDAQVLFNGRTNSNGMITASFTVPTDLDAPEQFLIITSDQLFGESAYSREIYVGTTYNVLASTDKPVYQPGQSIQIRVLALENISLAAAAGQTVHVRVQDPNGIYLMDTPVELDEWGVGSATFDLDTLAPSGDYRILAQIGPKESSRTVEVKPYTLPRFGIELETDRRYFDIEDTLTGQVSAQYFFGKPVVGAAVVITGTTAEVSSSTLLTLTGITDSEGIFAFETPVPDYFFDELTSGTEDLDLFINVADTAGNREVLEDSILVTADPLKVEVVPEGGFLHPGVENILYLEISEPDGAPFPSTVTVAAESLGVAEVVETDEFGLATVRLTPTDVEDLDLTITAAGETQSGDDIAFVDTVSVGTIGRTTSVLVRPDRAEYQIGDEVNLDFFTTDDVRTIYLDLVKERQTIDFRAINVSNGSAETAIALDGNLLGTLEINAYAVGEDGTLTRDRRLVLVNPAPATVTVTADADTYQPGDTANLVVEVAEDGAPLEAALGISIVDESVFAVGAKEPGFVRTYFLLQEELLERRYRISGFEPFGDDAPPAAPFEGIQMAADTALMGAFASVLAETEPMAYAPPAKQQASEPWSARFPWRDWNMRVALALPLLGMAVYERRNRTARMICLLTLLAGAMLLWTSCSSSPAGLPVPAPASESVTSAPPPANGIAVVEVSSTDAPDETRVRQFFPETLLWLPDLVTDENGRAEIDVPIADSITTWRVNVVASTKDGTLGSAQSALTVFQDFFIEPILPLQMTQNDSTEITVSVFNYLDEPQTITLSVQGTEGLAFVAQDGTQGPTEFSLDLAANEVTSARLPVRFNTPGTFTLDFQASGSRMSDTVRKTVNVVPDGERVVMTRSGVLARSQDEVFTLPDTTISGTAQLVTRIYPSPVSRFPLELPDRYDRDFCFYYDLRSIQPIALTAQYLLETDQLTPAQQLRTERLLHRGTQRLLRYFSHVAGGFTGECYLIFRPEPDPSASAAGLVALHDLEQIVYIDPEIQRRTLDYLAATQLSDGSWRADNAYWRGFVDSEDPVALTAFIVWSLGEVGLANSQLAQSGLEFVRANIEQVTSSHTQALIANALVISDPEGELTRTLLDGLAAQISANFDYDYGDTSALATLALVRSGRYVDETAVALTSLSAYLSNSYSYYWSQPGEIYAIRALLTAARQSPSQPQAGITLALNGADVASFAVSAENSQIRQQALVTAADAPLHVGDNEARLRLRGDAVVNYELQAEYYVPWETRSTRGPIALDVIYDSLEVRVGDTVRATAIVTNVAAANAGQILLELAVPAGFTAQAEEWMVYDSAAEIVDYQITPIQILVILDDLSTGESVTFSYRLQANVPGEVQIRPSRVYQAVTPETVTEVIAGQTMVAVR